MNTFTIYIIIAGYEILIAAYGIFLKSHKSEEQRMRYHYIRNIVRIAAFPLVIIFTIASVLPFDLRCLVLDLSVAIFAGRAVWNLVSFGRKKFNKPIRIGKTIAGCVGSLLFFFFALLPTFLFPQYTELKPTGEYQVATTDATITSKTVNNYYGTGMRKINVTIWYPKAPTERYPFLVFSHGAFGIRNSNYSAYEELASHGYVVCSIDHPGESFYTKDLDGKVTIVTMEYLKEVQGANTEDTYTVQETYDIIQKWMNGRTSDMNLALDTFLSGSAENQSFDSSDYPDAGEIQCNTSLEEIYQCIDTNEIGAFGHSMGAAASVQLARTRSDIDAVINIDGPYFSELKYDAVLDNFVAKGETYPTPILNIYSDQLWVQLNDGTSTGCYTANKISNQICTDSHDVYLKGTRHLSLTDLAITSPLLTNMLNGGATKTDAKETLTLENQIILEFFDAKLKGIGAFQSDGTYNMEK